MTTEGWCSAVNAWMGYCRAKKGIYTTYTQLYHEIVSLKRDDRLSLEIQQAIVHDVTMEWLAARAPEQLAYGRLHVARGHLHVHLMLSANRQGDERPVRLSKAEFAALQRQVEGRILARYPQLRQERVYDAPEREPRSFRHPRPEQQERPRPEPDAGRSADRDHVAAVVRDALAHATDGRSCQEALRACGVVTHRRGSTVSFAYRDRRYRLLSLGLPYESASRFHAYLGLPPPSPGRVAQAEREERATTTAPAEPTVGETPATEPAATSAPEPPKPESATAAAGGQPTPAASWRAIWKRQPAVLARDLRRMFELGVFGDTRSAYWGELVRAFQADRPAAGKPSAPSRRDLPGTRRMPLALRRILGAIQDEPAAFLRDLRRVFDDTVVGAQDKPPSLDEVAAQVGFRSSGPWRRLPPQVQRQAEERWRQQHQPAPAVPAEPTAPEPAQASGDAPAPPAEPAAPIPPMPDPRWEAERKRRQLARTALLRSFLRHQERERQWVLKRQRTRGRGRGRGHGDPGMGGI